jgi:hypothetical protein
MSQRANLLDEVDLLGPALSDDEDYRPINKHDHAVVTAPVITGDALNTLGPHSFPQTALYGRVISQHGEGLSRKSVDGRIFVNTNAPFSALVCGVQASFIYVCMLSIFILTEDIRRDLERATLRLSYWKVC